MAYRLHESQITNLAARKRMGLDQVSSEIAEQTAFKVLALLSRYHKEARWQILRKALEIDGAESKKKTPWWMDILGLR